MGQPEGRRLRFSALLLVATLFAGRPAPAEESPLRFKRLTTEQGLSDSTVEDIVQDRQGFMWFGTADGLNRYDGYTFKNYSHVGGDPTSLAGDYVWDLLVDSAGVLWIAGQEGLSRYESDTDSFVVYRHDHDDPATLSNNNVQEVYEDRQGALWIGTGEGLDRLDRESGTFTRFRHSDANPKSLSNDVVQAIHEDGRGRLWVGTRSGLNLFDRETGEFDRFLHDPQNPTSLSSDSVRSIHEDRLGHLWVGTENGPNRLDPTSPGRFVRYGPERQEPRSLVSFLVWTFYEDSRDVLWAGTDRGGLAYLDRARDVFVHHTNDPLDPFSISSDVVLSICEDDNGDLWTGNYAGGVNYLDRHGAVFEHFRHVADDRFSLSHDSVLSFWESSDGEVWVGTEDGLVRFDQEQRRFFRYRHDPRDPASLSAPAVMSVYEDRDGVLWVGTFAGGLNRFDRRSGTFTQVFPGETADPDSGSFHVNSIHEDHRGVLWVGTFEGLYRLNRDGEVLHRYTHDPDDGDSLAHEITWTILEDSQDRLWFGTHNGLSFYDRDRDAFVSYRHDPGNPASLSFDHIESIYEDSQGRLWIGTHGGGLNRFDAEEETFTSYRVSDGLPSDVVYGILEDRRENLWLSTNRGLARFDVVSGNIISYDENDGLQGRQFNRNAALKNASGEFFFGGIHGFNLFDPAAVQINTAVPAVVLTDFQLFNGPVEIGEGAPLEKPVNVAQRITLSHDQSVLSFAFAALSYRSPAKNRYAYRLEGFDSDWVYSGNARMATYTSLEPGTYTFRAKGTNNNGIWNEAGASIELVILPPYWATWWFRLLTVSALIGGITLAYRMRVRSITESNRLLNKEIAERVRVEEDHERLLQETEAKNLLLEAQNAELERFSYTVSHDLKSPLVTIRGFLDLLKRDFEAGDFDRVSPAVDRISGAADVMSQHLEDLLELSRTGLQMNEPEEVSLSAVARDAVERLGGSIEAGGVEVVVSPKLPVIRGDRLRLTEVYQNLIENAVKFMGDQPEPRVEIGARRDGDQEVCFVRDNGRGIEPRYADKVFGLFERLDRKTEGTGVGLALVRRIVQMHRGKVWVESDGLGHGATFCLLLPGVADDGSEVVKSPVGE